MPVPSYEKLRCTACGWKAVIQFGDLRMPFDRNCRRCRSDQVENLPITWWDKLTHPGLLNRH